MRWSGQTLWFLPLLALFAASLTACTSLDPAPIYMSITYQMRCVDCTPTAADSPVRDISLLDGEDGFTITCSASKTSSGKRQLSFSAVYRNPDRASDTFRVSVSQVNLDDKNPGSSCKVRAGEGSNTYLGGCTSGDPSAQSPCKILIKAVGSVVSGSLYCKTLPNGSNSMTTRYLVTPYTTSTPAKFELEGCTGL